MLYQHVRGFAALAVLGMGTAAQADILVNQMPTDQVSALSSANTPGQPVTRVADDFTLAGAPGTGYRLTRFVGQVMTSIGGDPTRYRVEMYADAGGTPGALLWARTGASYMNDMGLIQGNLRIQELIFNDNNVMVDANQRYWVSFVGLDGVSGFASHHWGATANGLTGRYTVGGGAWTDVCAMVSDYRDFAFRIEGSAMSVPAPGAAALIGAGGLAAMRRRRR